MPTPFYLFLFFTLFLSLTSFLPFLPCPFSHPPPLHLSVIPAYLSHSFQPSAFLNLFHFLLGFCFFSYCICNCPQPAGTFHSSFLFGPLHMLHDRDLLVSHHDGTIGDSTCGGRRATRPHMHYKRIIFRILNRTVD